MLKRLAAFVSRNRRVVQHLESIDQHLLRIDQYLGGIDWKIGQQVPHPISCEQQAELRSILRVLAPQNAVGASKARFGSSSDGGYVMLDDFSGIVGAVSLGIGNNNDWDFAVASQGIDVDQFDGSIEAPPRTHARLRFRRLMIDSAALQSVVAHQSISKRDDIILKVDIEGGEWDLFDQIDDRTLQCCSQILCEFHYLRRLAEHNFRAKAARVFLKIASTHAVIHVHGNNCCQYLNLGNVPLPDVIEISFASRNRYSFSPSDEIFPTSLDVSNSSVCPDHFLGAFRF